MLDRFQQESIFLLHRYLQRLDTEGLSQTGLVTHLAHDIVRSNEAATLNNSLSLFATSVRRQRTQVSVTWYRTSPLSNSMTEPASSFQLRISDHFNAIFDKISTIPSTCIETLRQYAVPHEPHFGTSPSEDFPTDSQPCICTSSAGVPRIPSSCVYAGSLGYREAPEIDKGAIERGT